MRIEDVYETLKEYYLCKSGHDFSRDYLGKHCSYLSVLRARKRQPSIAAWVMLNFTLQKRVQEFAIYDNEFFQAITFRLQELQHAVEINILQQCAARNQRKSGRSR